MAKTATESRQFAVELESTRRKAVSEELAVCSRRDVTRIKKRGPLFRLVRLELTYLVSCAFACCAVACEASVDKGFDGDVAC